MELDLDGAHAWFWLLGCFLSPLCRKKAKSSTRFPTPPAAHRTKSGPTWGHPGSGVFLWRRRLQMGLVGNLQEGAAALVERAKIYEESSPCLVPMAVIANVCGTPMRSALIPSHEIHLAKPIKVSISVRSGKGASRSKTAARLRRSCTGSTEKIEMFKSLESWAEESILPFLRPVEKCWQPQDYLPEPSSESFYDEVLELRERAESLRFCLVGDMTTEEALPTYLTMLNTLDGTRDETGASPSLWAVWRRAWTAEENRHGDVLNKYLYRTGRVDMKQIEKTIQYLIGSGMDPQTENNPYLGFIYTSFQERATAISHGNTARHARSTETTLATVCGLIAADEKRHENAYTRIVFEHFSLVAQRTGV
ncbi:hypothetical protein SELMODRAFT_418317 [Selaginella moellendorffii]|uniref:Acyl-[acyl-carrier-protein] desaturase n=1 Tax=Selaginella moellendorffii TaxID=88036 RepID=D8S5B7_SELML|nr:hypothetical protein SELMODRAFT_418317 [Selaginella moellendorffii]